MNTRKYPRTLNEAFGPYTSREVYDADESDYGAAWWVAITLVAMAALVVVVVLR